MKFLLTLFFVFTYISCSQKKEEYLYDKNDDEYAYYKALQNKKCVKSLTSDVTSFRKKLDFEDFEKKERFQFQIKDGDTISYDEVVQIVRVVNNSAIYFKIDGDKDFHCKFDAGCIVSYKTATANEFYTNLIEGSCSEDFTVKRSGSDTLLIQRKNEGVTSAKFITYDTTFTIKNTYPEFALMWNFTQQKVSKDEDYNDHTNDDDNVVTTNYKTTITKLTDGNSISDSKIEDLTACEVEAVGSGSLSKKNINQYFLQLNCNLTTEEECRVKEEAKGNSSSGC